MIKKVILHFLLFTMGFNLFAQNNKLEDRLKDYMKIVRTEKFAPSPEKELYASESAGDLLSLLPVYYSDTLAKVRSKAYYLTYKSAYRSNNRDVRYNAVFNLVQALNDQDPGNVGLVATWLTNFNSYDFTNRAKDSLRDILHNQDKYLDRIIKLTGFVGLEDQIAYLDSILTYNVYNSNKVEWATHLALARMGVKDEIDFCVDLVKKQPVNDDVIYELVPDLIYTRNKTAIDYLVTILQDDTKNCYSANPENSQKIACGYRLMEYLALVIKDFPLKLDSSGDLVADDYQKALKIARNWFVTHKADYTIIDETY